MEEKVADRIYHICGRKTHPEPLAYLGRLDIQAEEGLSEKALQRFGDAGWVELVAFPDEAIVRVLPGSPR